MAAATSARSLPPPNTPHSVQVYSPTYFALCAIGGVIACGPTHTLMCPIDVVKCNSQTDAKHFGRGTIRGLRYIYSGEAASLGFGSGLAGVCKGWGPTLMGYSLQGAGKYGGYEFFAYKYSQLVGKEAAEKYRPLVWAAASASAEFFADIALCPFEAVKVRIQTNPKYAIGLRDGMAKIIRDEGIGSLYAGIIPLWARQIPYTVIKFVAFEGIAEYIYTLLPHKKEEMTKLGQLGVVFSAGYIAGILCATGSHPADVLVSKINQVSTQGSFFKKANIIITGTAEQPGIGMKGLWSGLLPRIFMIGTLTGLQWLIYGTFKTQVGLPAPGGH